MKPSAALAVFLFFWIGVFTPVNKTGKDQTMFRVEKGEDAKSIAIDLRDRNFIRFVTPFRLFAMITNSGRRLQAGNYLLSQSMTPFSIMRKMERGDTVKETVTVVEGWNLRTIARELSAKTKIARDDMYAVTGYPGIAAQTQSVADTISKLAQKFSALTDKPRLASLEGYLFPDTYEIQPSETPKEIIEKMLANFSRKFAGELQAETARQNKTIFEVLTMASLLEKEVKTFEDKQIVAGILYKRLTIGMPLQIDATVNYITEKNTPSVSLEDTKISSPYNTYKFRGLPPGPIANPGLESIRAALQPVKSPYLYYLSTPEGTTIFSKTLEEHNAAKAKYLKKLAFFPMYSIVR